MSGDGDLHTARLTETPTATLAEPAVLLIEDDPGDALLTREYLADSGISNRFEHAGSLAEATAVSGRPDCTLLDLHLPDGQGLTRSVGCSIGGPVRRCRS